MFFKQCQGKHILNPIESWIHHQKRISRRRKMCQDTPARGSLSVPPDEWDISVPAHAASRAAREQDCAAAAG